MAEETSVLTLEIGGNAEQAQQAIENIAGGLDALNSRVTESTKVHEEFSRSGEHARSSVTSFTTSTHALQSSVITVLGPMGEFASLGREVGAATLEAGHAMTTGFIPAVGGLATVLGAGLAAFTAMGLEAGNWANEMMRLQAVTGLNQHETEQWSHAMAISGGNAQQLERASTMLYRSLSEVHDWLQKGSGEAPKAARVFHDLGIAVLDAHGGLRSFADVFPELMDKLGHMEDATRRNEIVVELFGARMGRGLIPLLNNYTEVMGNATKVTDSYKMGIEDATKVSIEFNTQMAQLNHDWHALSTQAGPPFLSLLDKIVLGLNAVAQAAKNAVDWTDRYFKERARGVYEKQIGADKGPVLGYERVPFPWEAGFIGPPTGFPSYPEAPSRPAPGAPPPLRFPDSKKSLDELLANMTGLRDAQEAFNELVKEGHLKEAAELYMRFGESAESAVSAVRAELEKLVAEQKKAEEDAEKLAKKLAKEQEQAAEELQKGWEKAVEANNRLQAENKRISEESIAKLLAEQTVVNALRQSFRDLGEQFQELNTEAMPGVSAEQWMDMEKKRLDQLRHDHQARLTEQVDISNTWLATYRKQNEIENKIIQDRWDKELEAYKTHNRAILQESESLLRAQQAQQRYFDEQRESEELHKKLIAMGVPEELAGVNVTGGGRLAVEQALARAQLTQPPTSNTNVLLQAILDVLMQGHTIEVDGQTLGRTATQGSTLNALNLGRVGVGRI